jgi:hypothetical protein
VKWAMPTTPLPNLQNKMHKTKKADNQLIIRFFYTKKPIN